MCDYYDDYENEEPINYQKKRQEDEDDDDFDEWWFFYGPGSDDWEE